MRCWRKLVPPIPGIWSYPPHFLLFTWSEADAYMLAYMLYSLFGLILYLAVVTDRRLRADHLVLILARQSGQYLVRTTGSHPVFSSAD
jgi:hypothetical protein